LLQFTSDGAHNPVGCAINRGIQIDVKNLGDNLLRTRHCYRDLTSFVAPAARSARIRQVYRHLENTPPKPPERTPQAPLHMGAQCIGHRDVLSTNVESHQSPSESPSPFQNRGQLASPL